MKYTTYIIQSLKNGRYYIGHTSDISNRLDRHNNGLVKSTKSFLPWKVVHVEKFGTKPEAYKREMEIKKYKGGILFKRLVGRFDKITRFKKKTNQLFKY